MTAPLNLMLTVQDAVFEAMAEHVPAEQGGAHQHVLQDTKPPLNIIGNIELANEGSEDEQLERFVVEIQSIYRGGDRRQLITQMHAVRVALDQRKLPSDVADLRKPRFLDAAASDVGPDGQTYVGVSNFEIYAEPA